MEPVLPQPNSPEGSLPNQDVQPVLSQLGTAESAPNTAAELPREVRPASVLPQPVSVSQSVVASTTDPAIVPAPMPTSSDDPQVADDVDVIEKEWVDKAKRIVTATKDNPHQQEKEVSRLQADYLMKRYNKKVKLSE